MTKSKISNSVETMREFAKELKELLARYPGVWFESESYPHELQLWMCYPADDNHLFTTIPFEGVDAPALIRAMSEHSAVDDPYPLAVFGSEVIKDALAEPQP